MKRPTLLILLETRPLTYKHDLSIFWALTWNSSSAALAKITFRTSYNPIVEPLQFTHPEARLPST